MQFCNEHGIPHSQFLEWDDIDRAKALAFVQESNLRCSLCGTAEWEWEENRQAYEPRVRKCMGCYHREAYSKDLDSKGPGETVGLVRVTPELRRKDRELVQRLQALKERDELERGHSH